MKPFIVLLLLVCLLMPVPLQAYDFGQRMLQQGMRGSEVESLQKALVQIGYELQVDGIFGKQTDAVIRDLQTEMGLVVDGIVGRQTMETIEQKRNSLVSYVVRAGDTLYDLARYFGTTVNKIIGLNRLSTTLIRPGQELLIASSQLIAKTEHVVQSGENLTVIARRFGSSISEIREANSLANPDRLLPGQKLQIPVAVQATAATALRQTTRPVFTWPVQGRISSSYGWRIHPITRIRHFHGGLDIAVPKGTPIRAAAAGRVITAGSMGTFGLGVVIDHGNGYTSWYGHNSSIQVRVGDYVAAGQQIAKAGSTGLSTGPHLDFRIKHNDKTINPHELLPK